MATPDRRAGLAGQHDLAAPWLLAFALLWIALLLSGVARAATGEPGAAAGTGAAVTERSAVALGQRLYEDGIVVGRVRGIPGTAAKTVHRQDHALAQLGAGVQGESGDRWHADHSFDRA